MTRQTPARTGRPDPFAGKTWWIVGASEGLGRALAHALSDAGAKLVLSARNEEQLGSIAASLDAARALPVDVTDDASVLAAGSRVADVDGIIYCAGNYTPMHATRWDTAAAMAMTEVNFCGALRVLGTVLPRMAQSGSGHVVLIGSLAGHRGLPGAIGYGASKAALMHLGENLRADLKNTGVRVQVVNPGFIRTRLTAKNQFHMPQILSPEDAANRTVRAIRSGRFSTSFPTPFAWLFTLGRHLPLGLFQMLFGGNSPRSGEKEK